MFGAPLVKTLVFEQGAPFIALHDHAISYVLQNPVATGTVTCLTTSAQVIALPTLPSRPAYSSQKPAMCSGVRLCRPPYTPVEVSHLIEIFLVHVVGLNEGLKHRLAVAVRRVFSLVNHAHFFIIAMLHGDDGGNARSHDMFAGGSTLNTTAPLRTLMFSSSREIPHEIVHRHDPHDMHQFRIVEAPSIPARRVTHTGPMVQSGFIHLIELELHYLFVVFHQDIIRPRCHS